ncbi:tetratricopeptide repeat protein [Catenovulum agarivorans]|uniref:tetratricopeptide repeat protein n=1 Tax=Catenovulum agarivorans TaxID=1172192 RepID=UPI0003662C88|nr:DUF6340 family protein [Catenovulum agarivorans]
MLKSAIRNTVFTLVLLTLSACSSMRPVNVPMVMPSESNVKISSLSVAPFRVHQGTLSTKLAKVLLSRSSKLTGNILANAIKANIIKEGYIKLASPAEFTLIGEVVINPDEFTAWEDKYEDKEGKTKYTYHAKLTKSILVSYTLSNATEQLAAGSQTFTESTYNSSKKSKSEAKSKLRKESDLHAKLIEQASNQIVKEISPHKKNVKVNFMKGDQHIDVAIEYVKRGRYQQAMSLFMQIAEKSSELEVQTAAIHNQGMVKLIQGEYTEAHNLLRKANLLNPQKLEILDSIEVVEKLKYTQDKLSAQIGKP